MRSNFKKEMSPWKLVLFPKVNGFGLVSIKCFLSRVRRGIKDRKINFREQELFFEVASSFFKMAAPLNCIKILEIGHFFQKIYLFSVFI